MMRELADAAKRCPEILLLFLPLALMVVLPFDTKTRVPCDRFHDVPNIRYEETLTDDGAWVRPLTAIQEAMPPECPYGWERGNKWRGPN